MKSQTRLYGGGYRSYMNNTTSTRNQPKLPKSPASYLNNNDAGNSQIGENDQSFLNGNLQSLGHQSTTESEGADFFALLNDIYEKNRQ